MAEQGFVMWLVRIQRVAFSLNSLFLSHGHDEREKFSLPPERGSFLGVRVIKLVKKCLRIVLKWLNIISKEHDRSESAAVAAVKRLT